MRRTGLLAGLAIAACAAPSGSAAFPDPEPVLAEVREQFGVPALAAALLEHGELERVAAVGLRRADHADPVSTDDAWQLGSCTKAMTSTLAAILVERGALRWDATLAECFPERAGSMHAAYRDATLRELLDHRAGLPEDHTYGPPAARFVRGSRSTEAQRLAVLDRIASAAPAGPRGARAYSNAGYVIVGAMVERATGAAWEEAMRRELFEPLGMASAGFVRAADEAVEREPWGHRASDQGPRPVDPRSPLGSPPPFYGPAGAVRCSLADWARFASLHLGVGGEDLLSGSRLKRLHTPLPGADYTAGFAVGESPWTPGTVLAHDGSSALWYASMLLAPDAGLGLLVVCNQGGEVGQAACREVVRRLTADATVSAPRERSKHGDTREHAPPGGR